MSLKSLHEKLNSLDIFLGVTALISLDLYFSVCAKPILFFIMVDKVFSNIECLNK